MSQPYSPCGLRLPRRLWNNVLAALRVRTEDESHESGAFLLGRVDTYGRRVTDVLFFEDLFPAAYARGIVELPSSAFRSLWAIVRDRGLQVVADIHVHPWSARQSDVDRRNPLIALKGHVAIILPNFARPPIRRWAIGVYEYQGDHQWQAHGGCDSEFIVLENDGE